MKPSFTSVIIPAHNEESRLGSTLETYTHVLRRQYGDDGFEVLVVANACTDRTAQVTTAFGAVYEQVRLIDIAAPVGKGGAILEGFRQARGQNMVFADADGATAPESLCVLLDALAYADIAIGSRWVKGSLVRRPQPLERRIFSRLFNASVRYLFDLPYHDTQCGAKAFRRSVARQLAAVVSETRWAFDVDLLLWARFLNLAVAELPVVWDDQAGSKLRIGTTLREVSVALWDMRRRNMHSIWLSHIAQQTEEVAL